MVRNCLSKCVWFVSLAGAVLALSGALADAQVRRLQPPMPSAQPWIGSQSVGDLTAAIADYQRIVAAGGWPMLPNRVTLRAGDSNENVLILRRRLKISGELPASARGDYLFDAVLEDAVKRFQLRNGLEPTGIVYGITQRTLNVPAATRLKQLQMNLARVQELSQKVASTPKYILMNAASFELQGIANGRVEVRSRTIAGKRGTPTPTVSASVRAINILPYWHVPGSIAKAALVPMIRKDPSYLYRERIRVFSSFGGEEIDPSLVNWWGPESDRYVFRQDPGPQNALGVLRFDMPNKHIVYMHDTPMKNLFSSFERAFSAGCIRVQDFLDLAEWVTVGQDGWAGPRFQSAIDSGVAQTIKLAAPVPVHFIYLTAWVENGVLQFRNDLYNRDDDAFTAEDDVSSRVVTTSIAP
jgi:murein L,D-transpeptidase YcbB/YkuD